MYAYTDEVERSGLVERAIGLSHAQLMPLSRDYGTPTESRVGITPEW